MILQIDLLAAARCNMFSHVLSTYQNSFLNFSTKVAQTLLATIENMNAAPQYEFCILKSLQEGEDVNQDIQKDKDQMLFFQVNMVNLHKYYGLMHGYATFFLYMGATFYRHFTDTFKGYKAVAAGCRPLV